MSLGSEKISGNFRLSRSSSFARWVDVSCLDKPQAGPGPAGPPPRRLSAHGQQARSGPRTGPAAADTRAHCQCGSADNPIIKMLMLPQSPGPGRVVLAPGGHEPESGLQPWSRFKFSDDDSNTEP